MGRWSQARKRGGASAVPQLEAPVITSPLPELVEVTSANDPEAYAYWWAYVGPTAEGPWTLHLAGQAINLPLPNSLDYATYAGFFAMVRQGTGIEPLSPDSNVVVIDS